jgi:hypothetical protein
MIPTVQHRGDPHLESYSTDDLLSEGVFDVGCCCVVVIATDATACRLWADDRQMGRLLFCLISLCPSMDGV